MGIARSKQSFPFQGVARISAVFAGLLAAASPAQAAASVTLTWTASNSSDVAGYHLSYGQASGNYTQRLDLGKATSAAVTGLDDGTTYYFVVTAYNAAASESSPSNEVNLTTPAAPGPSPTPTPTPSPTATQAVIGFALINADTDQPVAGYEQLTNGAVINSAALPTAHLNIRAHTNPAVVGSVRFGFDGKAHAHTENIVPYSIFGDQVGDYARGTLAAGRHTLSATPFTQRFGGGNPGKSLSISFSVISGSSSTSTSSPTPAQTSAAAPTPTVTPAPASSPGANSTPGPIGNEGYVSHVSTRMWVDSADSAITSGFVIGGTDPKTVILRALGPSLAEAGVAGAVADPKLDLFDSTGTLIASNDNWRDSRESNFLEGAPFEKLQPANELESAVAITLQPGVYTVAVHAANGSTGVALTEVYDYSSGSDSKLINVRVRGLVGTGDNLLVSGLTVGGDRSTNLLVRALGPSLANEGIADTLSDPSLEIYDSSGSLIRSDDNWTDNLEEATRITESGFAPGNVSEPAITVTLEPGNYTIVVQGKNDLVGVALLELHKLP